MAYQVRSYYETIYVSTIYHALKRAREDPYVWKISFQEPFTRLNYRLIRDDEDTRLWYQQPIPFGNDYADPRMFTESELDRAFFYPMSSA